MKTVLDLGVLCIIILMMPKVGMELEGRHFRVAAQQKGTLLMTGCRDIRQFALSIPDRAECPSLPMCYSRGVPWVLLVRFRARLECDGLAEGIYPMWADRSKTREFRLR